MWPISDLASQVASRNSGQQASAINGVFAGGADVAPGEKEAVGRLAAELGEHEEVAVGSKTALLLAVELRP